MDSDFAFFVADMDVPLLSFIEDIDDLDVNDHDDDRVILHGYVTSPFPVDASLCSLVSHAGSIIALFIVDIEVTDDDIDDIDDDDVDDDDVDDNNIDKQ
jgi:hypothetical protein